MTYPRTWTLCGWRMVGETTWRKSGAIDPVQAQAAHIRREAEVRAKTAGGKELLEVRAR